MRKIIITVVIFTLLLSGCTSDSKSETPQPLYFPNSQISYGSDDGFISSEPYQGTKTAPEDILREYFLGPADPNLYNPFPANTTLISFEITNDTCTIVLSDCYAALSGIQLTTANICVAQTVMKLTGVIYVTISCESEKLQGEESITYSPDMILWIDESVGHHDPSATTSVLTES